MGVVRLSLTDSVNKQAVREFLDEVAQIRVSGVFAREFAVRVPPEHEYAVALVDKLIMFARHERNELDDEQFLQEVTSVERRLSESSKSLRRAEIR